MIWPPNRNFLAVEKKGRWSEMLFESRKKRRARLKRQQFPPEWLTIVKRNVPYYSYLPNDAQNELQGLILIFLEEKEFEGCDGLKITDEIRLIIAAQACILLLGRETDIYPTLRSILVYPHGYVAPIRHRQPDGTIVEGVQPRLGESWSRGNVVLSWDDVRKGASDIHDGHNLVFHEFAHQLDNESGAAEGVPELPKRSMYIAWARVLGREYETLIHNVEMHRPTLLDQYGANNPAEFFAVATECFFEKAFELKRLHPQLYETLQSFFQQDPATFIGRHNS
jgi:Mlc titration factor MtfA (ptsG expression regulator)